MFLTFHYLAWLCFLLGASAYTLNCALPLSSSQYTFGVPSWQSDNYTCHGLPHVYTVQPSPGKGLGVFAVRPLEVGDIVMRETPVLRIVPPKFVKGTGYPMSEIGRLVRAEFEKLSAQDQAEVLSLTHYATDAERAKGMDVLAPIFRTNAYNTGKDIGLFPKIARINHSCRPNASYFWSDKLNKRVVYATRKIEEGEEIFVSFISLLLTHEERQKHLDRYGFKCTCDACAQEAAAMQVSDKRRSDIRKAFADFESQLKLDVPQTRTGRLRARKNAQASIQLAELVEEEGLADYYAQAYRIAAISHARIEDWEPATLWAHKSYRLRVMADAQSQDTLEMHALTSRFISSWESDLKNRSMLQDKPK